jgi:hypothetical protein
MNANNTFEVFKQFERDVDLASRTVGLTIYQALDQLGQSDPDELRWFFTVLEKRLSPEQMSFVRKAWEIPANWPSNGRQRTAPWQSVNADMTQVIQRAEMLRYERAI